MAPDETGWRVAGTRAWLWAVVGANVTVSRIARGRGSPEAAAILGQTSAGVIERDGWAPYRRVVAATQQTCLAHLLRRCQDLLDDAQRGQARTPMRWVASCGARWRRALVVRDARDAGQLGPPRSPPRSHPHS